MRICIAKVVRTKQCEKSIKNRQKKKKTPESTELQWANEPNERTARWTNNDRIDNELTCERNCECINILFVDINLNVFVVLVHQMKKKKSSYNNNNEKKK